MPEVLINSLKKFFSKLYSADITNIKITNRADIVGVIYPNLMDDQLKYFLYHYAKLSNRRLVILDRDFMLKLLDRYIEERGL